MNNRVIRVAVILAIGLALVSVFFGVIDANATHHPGLNATIWIDDFDSPSLNTMWSWIREDSSHWSLTDQPGYLRITTQEGGIWGSFQNNQANILLITSPPGDYRITTKVTISPTQDFQHAGLIIYQDDDNYLKLNRQFTSNNRVELIRESSASPTFTFVTDTSTTVFLAIQKQGSVYTGTYSVDGINWIVVGAYAITLSNPLIGLNASNETFGTSTEIPADFEFFQVEGLSYFGYLPIVTRN